MDKISDHISYNEATRSNTAERYNIDNTPNEEQLEAMKLVAEKCFEPVRKHHGKPIFISSFFRSIELNKKIGGSGSSQHCKGEAIDIDADIFKNGISNADIFNYIKDNCEWDQMIWEFGTDENPSWVHVSYTNKRKNRKQILKAIKINGKTKYISYE